MDQAGQRDVSHETSKKENGPQAKSLEALR